MLSHSEIWNTIDLLAKKNDLTTSGLARKSGLDATSFNKSKRVSSKGRLRWPSLESLIKVLEATNSNFSEFFGIIEYQQNGSSDEYNHYLKEKESGNKFEVPLSDYVEIDGKRIFYVSLNNSQLVEQSGFFIWVTNLIVGKNEKRIVVFSESDQPKVGELLVGRMEECNISLFIIIGRTKNSYRVFSISKGFCNNISSMLPEVEKLRIL